MLLVFVALALAAYSLLSGLFLDIPIMLGLVSPTAYPGQPPHSLEFAAVLFMLRVVIPSCAMAGLAMKVANVRQRLADPQPGQAFMLAGIALTAAKYIALSLPSLVSGLSRSDDVLQAVRMVAWLALPFLLIGVYKALVAPVRSDPSGQGASCAEAQA